MGQLRQRGVTGTRGRALSHTPGTGDDGVVRAHPEGALLHLRVVAGARRTEVTGVAGQALRFRVAAPPAQGRANAAILAHLAALLGLRPRDLEIAAGQRSRDKLVLVRGLAPERVRERLGVAPGR
ncbi:MAG TPA: DUF167 family protein [Actinomycetes bacterium]|nr:DUF167 family protein [Actinomycetes bacterium]